MTTLVFRTQTWADCEHPPSQGGVSHLALTGTGSSTKTQLYYLTFVIEVHFQKHNFHCLAYVIFYDSSSFVKQLSKCIPHLLQMYSMVKNNCASCASPAF